MIDGRVGPSTKHEVQCSQDGVDQQFTGATITEVEGGKANTRVAIPPCSDPASDCIKFHCPSMSPETTQYRFITTINDSETTIDVHSRCA